MKTITWLDGDVRRCHNQGNVLLDARGVSMKRILLVFLMALPCFGQAPVIGAPSGTSSVVPTGATPYSVTLAQDAAKNGVLLDTFKQAGDADDTASFTRAMTACVPIALGARTYTVNDFNTGTGCAAFILKGIKGASVIQRTTATYSAFFHINSATVYIDGVTFDANKASVTANQWGVLINQGGQSVSISNSIFKNNSGTLGNCLALLSTGPAAGGWFSIHDNEVTGCASNSMFLGSVSHGTVTNNYVHDNAGSGIFASSYTTATSTNYLSDVLIANNIVVRNTNSNGIAVGGISPPYVYGTPSAVRVQIIGNALQDNGGSASSGYQLGMQGDYIDAIGNTITQSAPTVPVFGGIDCNSRYMLVSENRVTLAGASYGIDCGGSISAHLAKNVVTMNSGASINIGANINSTVEENIINASGTAFAVTVGAIEGDGNGGIFPTITSNVIIKRNTITMDGSGSRGILVADNAGGYPAATAPVQVFNNDFYGINGSATTFAIDYFAAPKAIQIQGNTFNGSSTQFVDPNANGDVVIQDVYDDVRSFSSTSPVRSVVTQTINQYGNGSVLYITPTSTGSGYTAATVINITGTGCVNAAATPLINQGNLVGVKMTNVGSSCTGVPTATATDTGGGTGAVLSVGYKALLPAYRKITWFPNGNLFKQGGGYIPLYPSTNQYPGGPVTLTAFQSGDYWQLSAFTLASYALASLPTCNSSASGAQVIVSSGSLVNGWLARCDGTSWRWPSGTVVN